MHMLKVLICLGVLTPSSHLLANECPLSPAERTLLQEAAIRNRQEAAWIVGSSSIVASRAYARNLIGSTSAHIGVATLAQQCTAPITYEPYCEPCNGDQPCPALRRCSQLACEHAGVDTVRAWWEPAPFSYRTDQPYFQGHQVAYALEPTTRIRYDTRSPGMLSIQWFANDDATVTAGGSTSNASSIVLGRGARNESGPQYAAVQAFYPRLGQALSLIRLNLNIDEHGVLSGDIRTNALSLATITENSSEQLVQIDWIAACR